MDNKADYGDGMKYEDRNKLSKPRVHITVDEAETPDDKTVEVVTNSNKPKKFNFIKEYFLALIEVVLK